MCGIFCTISRGTPTKPSNNARNLLQERGPDIFHSFTRSVRFPDTSDSSDVVSIHFAASVLALRGSMPVNQPLEDPDRKGSSVLCWNGEAWKTGNSVVTGNDGSLIMSLLLQASSQKSSKSEESRILRVLEEIRGPFAFVFYDDRTAKLYYGRDCLGRRSLMKANADDGTIMLSSVADLTLDVPWSEVDADGVYVIDTCDEEGKPCEFTSTFIPSVVTQSSDFILPSTPYLALPFTDMNKDVTNFPTMRMNTRCAAVTEIEVLLKMSVELRTNNIHQGVAMTASQRNVNVAILFSGGLDCTLLARLTHESIPPSEEIDLLNVAFENPRIHKSTSIGSFYETCPDRITARASLAELEQTCPGRTFRLVCIDVPHMSFQAHRQQVIDLMHPHNTEMDLSIAIALYFASRGIGTVSGPDVTSGEGYDYETPARVLLSGLGADELFGGYRRHENAFSVRGLTGEGGLLDSLAEDINRIGKRNLGRDDRVISHWGKEARYPFLDEDVVAWALQAPVWEKVGFGFEIGPSEEGGDLEAGKLVLRLIAEKLGMNGVAREKKRAIQFGARTAKMGVGSGKTKGTQQLS